MLTVALAMSACGGGDNESEAPVQNAEARCAALAKAAYPDAVLSTVEYRPAGGFTTPDGVTAIEGLPEFCRVAASLRPSSDSDIRVEVWLPTAGWNGKFLGLGNGGFAGALDYRELAAGLNRGFAVAHTDMGTAPAASQGGAVLIGHPEKWIDWGYRSTHLMTTFAKWATAEVLDSAPKRSYFIGCSTGGGQGISEATRYPDDYDGIVSGAPVPSRVGTHVGIGTKWVGFREDSAPLKSVLTAPKLDLLHRSVLASCDALDGVSDGLVARPDLCNFNPAVLQCSASGSTDCLTSVELAAVEKAYAPVRHVNGQEIFPGLEKGSEDQWLAYTFDLFSHAPFSDLFQWVLGPSFDFRDFNYGSDMDLVDSVVGPVVNNNNPDMRAFKARGGKFLAYQGLSDVLIPPGSIHQYLRQVESTTTGTDTFVRLFEAPGMSHCAGGAGPNMFGNSLSGATVDAKDPSRDLIAALDKWVETGVAPERIVATKKAGDAPEGDVVRTLPLCAYPNVARFSGVGDPNLEASYACGPRQ
ncbi:tannase/feruloyl esterase family alpha/beta hydrolase [Pseudorhodoferax sp. Leaf265]|uniref:tannase/feruloyl esterase family alpha/beta hydrolase n=1 Tax=Pseudorhodoferax sp. Leaf265 TaxID=1736315 RepID=UPI000A5B517B|nr:tannase/feruloyl esterase family alpha/beta hydrolase [Pseudorhodoferax sp. Leaf265]